MANALTIRLDPKLAEALEEEAKRSGASKGEIVREAIRDRLASTRRSALEALDDLDGIVQGPRDLSTNKAHLAGLGRPRARR